MLDRSYQFEQHPYSELGFDCYETSCDVSAGDV
jgi:hypothetical protein